MGTNIGIYNKLYSVFIYILLLKWSYICQYILPEDKFSILDGRPLTYKNINTSRTMDHEVGLRY